MGISKEILFKNIFGIIILIKLSSINAMNQISNYNMEDSNKIKIIHGNLNSINSLEDVYDDDDDDEDLVTRDKNCNMTEYPEQAEKCNRDNMVCTDEKYLHHCSCKDGYITIPRQNYTYCNLEQKKQVIAFFLEFCMGFGAGHFYRGAYTMGALKLVAFIFGIVFICSFPITAKYVSDCDCEFIAIILSIIYYLYLCALSVWYIWDLVYFGNNYYKEYTYLEGNEIEINLKSW
jgi:hypothetical protein